MNVGNEGLEWEMDGGLRLSVEGVAPQTFRIRLRNDPAYESALIRYGILHLPTGADRGAVKIIDEEPMAFVLSDGYALRVDTRSKRLWLEDRDGRSRLQTVEAPVRTTGGGWRIAFVIDRDERIYGLGDAAPERLQRGGLKETLRIDSSVDCNPIPYVMSGGGWALLAGTTTACSFDIARETDRTLTIAGESGELDLFLFAGESMVELLDKYTDIAGKPSLLPIWAYGLSFHHIAPVTAKEVVYEALAFRQADIPCDGIGLRQWTQIEGDASTGKEWHAELFPHMSAPRDRREFGFIDMLRRHGFKLGLALRSNDDLIALEERGRAEAPYGSPAPDQWYGHLERFVEDGAVGFQLMSSLPTSEFGGRERADERFAGETRNLYPVLYGKRVYNGFCAQTGTRPFVQIGFGYTGLQQFAATPSGKYDSMGSGAVSLLSLGLSGQAHAMSKSIHVDSPEGIHFGFLQACSVISNRTHFRHPSFLETRLQRLFRSYAKLRYRLLPYLYTTAHVASLSGMPIMRAMPLMFPDDPHCHRLDFQYMLGDSLLVGAYTRSVYLPEGLWIDFWTGKRFAGGKTIQCDLPDNSGGPLFIRGGAILPMWPQMDYVGQAALDRIELHIYPDRQSEFTLYEDDGLSLRYKQGAISSTRIVCETNQERTSVWIGPRAGAYEGMPEKRTYDIWLHMSGKPSKVRVQDETLPEQTRRIRQDPSNGWQYDRASEWLRMGAVGPDSPDKPLRITVENARTRRVQPPSESKPGTVHSGKREWSVATLDSVLEGENWAEIESGLSVWWQEQFGRTDSKRGTAETWRLRLMNVLTWLVQRAERNGHDPYEVFGEDMNLLFELRQLETEDEGWQLLRRLAEKQVRYGRSAPASSRHPVIREMVAIIEQQLDRDLSLRDLAKRAGMHPVHLSRLFKKEQGMSFSDFLLKQRMLAAKRLLESGMKVYETADRTGFKDAGNFSRSFHRYWGAPPIQFKHSPSDR